MSKSKTKKINLDLGSRSYSIHLAEALPKLIELNLGERVFIISDKNVSKIYFEDFTQNATNLIGHYFIDAGEQSKSLSQAEDIFTALIQANANRKTIIIALGGGVVGDLAGFVASTFMRGVPFYQIPTSLLAMVDSSVGGKVAVNHKLGKNIIGNFYQPKAVFIAINTLKTLPARELSAGLAEVVKYGIILDAPFYHWLEENLSKLLSLDSQALLQAVEVSVRTKADVVSQDEFETKGLRALLNLGHTFGHAEENLSGYGKVLHGEAVASGIIAACTVSVKLGKMNQTELDSIHKFLKTCKLPTKLSTLQPFDAFWKAMEGDKKNIDGNVNFIIPEKIGECKPPMPINKKIIEESLR